MSVDVVLASLRENRDRTALISGDRGYTYEDILRAYDKWQIKLEALPRNSIVAVRGEFDASSIALKLALLSKASIYAPLAKVIKNVEKYLQIAQVEFYIDLSDEQITKLDHVVEHEILLNLKSSDCPGLILFSSGTTGEPKAAVHNLVPMLEKYTPGGKRMKSIAFLLFDHIGGFHTVMYNIVNGGTLVTLDERTVEEVCGNIERHQIELLPTTPSFINVILFSKVYEQYDLSSLKIVSYGTEPMPESTLVAFHEVFPEIKLKQTYGLSEVGIMRTKSEGSDSLWLKVGGDDNHQTKIVDDILWIKSKMSMLGYLNAPSPFDDEGWLNTKDKVEVKGDYVKILGRESELINVGGEKVYPAEVESVVLEIEGVKDCIVSSEDNPLMGKVVVTKVVIDESLNEKEMKKVIKRYCNKRLEKFKRPVKIYFEKGTFSTDRFKKQR